MNRKLKAVLAAVLASATVAASALAVQTNFDDIDLLADGGDAVFVYGFDYGCIDGDSGSDGDFVYSVEDGSFTGMSSDAYDGFFAMYVNDAPFTQPTGMADFRNDNSIRSSVRKMSGVKVSRRGDSFPGSPTLRELIKFTNTKTKAVKLNVLFANEYGSDRGTFVADSSSGDGKFNRFDRWGITTDDQVAPTDPVVTLVNYGKGRVTKPVSQIGPISSPDDGVNVSGADCALDTFVLRLKPKQTRYLMVFTEVNPTIADAQSSAKKFDRKGLDATLLTGIGQGVRKKIANWDVD